MKTSILVSLLNTPARKSLALVYRLVIFVFWCGIRKCLKNSLLLVICFFSTRLLVWNNSASKMAALEWRVAHRLFIWLAEDLIFLGK